ncbi:uncharacterized protein [Panulirus ornatus]|uniref:uncharacterized protein n=1 Tax=Panulirus ornatus TaxID=150431 RepID=UPI003A877B5E
MCAARGGPQGDVRHPSSAPGARLPQPEMQSPRSLPGPGEGGDSCPGHLTQPSPRALHLQQLPACLTRLGRSPEAERPERAWTVRGEAGATRTDIIITDICLNHKPELTLNTHPQPQPTQLRQLSVADLQKQASHLPYNSQLLLQQRRHHHEQQQQDAPPAQQGGQTGGCCLLGAARAFLTQLVSLVRSGAVCGQAWGHQDGADEGGARGWPATQQQQEEEGATQLLHPPHNPPVSVQEAVVPRAMVAPAIVAPEVVVTPEREAKPPPETRWPEVGGERKLQPGGRLTSSSADPICLSPGGSGAAHLLQPPPDGGLRVARSLLDIQRERERAELHPARYLDDLRVLYNIHRRELVSQLVYREAGQIFQRGGGAGEPRPLRRVTGSPARHVIKADPQTHESKQRLVKKIASLRPMVTPRVGQLEPCWGDSEFVQACLKAHNLYRARHSAPPLTLSSQLCRQAQAWVNQLAHTGTLRHRGEPGLGENLFCRNTALVLRGHTSLMPDITGEEVAAYWYSSVRQYKFNRPPNVLQASQGPFTQMVWEKSREFGVGKARSRSGKIIVVAHYTPAGNIENNFKENVHPLNTRALAAEILGQLPGLTTLEQVDGRMVERVMGVLAAQPPRLTGRNATKVIAAHLLGHTASLVTTPEEEIRVVINTYASPRRHARKRVSFQVNPSGPFNALSTIPEASCCPPRLRLRTRASVSPADIQSSVMHEPSESHGPDDDAVGPAIHWLQPQSSRDVGDNGQTEVIELKRGDLGTPSSDMEDLSSLSLSVSPNYSTRSKKSRLKKGGPWDHGAEYGSTDLDVIRRESFDSVDSQSHPEPNTPSRWRENPEREEAENSHGDKHSLGLKLPFDIPDAEHGRMNSYALSPMRY